MILPLVFHPKADKEFCEAGDWYESRSPGLGEEFRAMVRDELLKIQSNPELHPVAASRVRRKVLNRFPYAILYRMGPSHIEIVAVFHARRNPAIWQSR